MAWPVFHDESSHWSRRRQLTHWWITLAADTHSKSTNALFSQIQSQSFAFAVDVHKLTAVRYFKTNGLFNDIIYLLSLNPIQTASDDWNTWIRMHRVEYAWVLARIMLSATCLQKFRTKRKIFVFTYKNLPRLELTCEIITVYTVYSQITHLLSACSTTRKGDLTTNDLLLLLYLNWHLFLSLWHKLLAFR